MTLFSAPNYCGEFDNAGGMMSVDETLMCSFQVLLRSLWNLLIATLTLNIIILLSYSSVQQITLAILSSKDLFTKF